MWESACGIQKHFDKRPSKRLGLDQFRYWPSAAAKDTAWLLSIKSSTAISARPRNGHYKSRKKSRKPFAFATLYSRRRRQPKKNKKKEEGTTINRVVTISGGRTPFPAQKKKENLVCLIKFVCVCVCVKQRPSGEIIDFLSPARQKHSILFSMIGFRFPTGSSSSNKITCWSFRPAEPTGNRESVRHRLLSWMGAEVMERDRRLQSCCFEISEWRKKKLN